jgi:ankyrin repeat protein
MTPIENIKNLIEEGSLEGLKSLASQMGLQALISERDPKFSRQALHWAARANRASIASWLIDSGADMESADIDKSRPLHVAAMNGASETVKALIARKAQVDAPRRDGKTAYMFAQSLSSRGAGFSACAALLSQAGANVKAADAEGKTAMEHQQEIDLIAKNTPCPTT